MIKSFIDFFIKICYNIYTKLRDKKKRKELITMDKLRIIGLDDDNHSPCFLCEEGTRFETYKELVDFLCKPHDCEIEVRMFAIVDPLPVCGLVDFTYEEIDGMFYHLEGIGGKVPAGIHPDLVFDLFWCAANRRHW